MKLFKKFSYALFTGVLMLCVSSCDLFDLDINKDPNNPTSATPNLLLTRIETDLAFTFQPVGDNLSGFMAILSSADDFGLANQSYNGTWGALYSGPLKDLDLLIKATEGTSPVYNGIAKTLKAYAFTTMVDLFGDVPFSEAFLGDEGNLTPKFDNGQAIYNACLALLDDANGLLKQPSPVAVSGDVMLGNSAAAWRRFNRSLKFELLMKTRLRNANAKAELEAILAASGTDPVITATSQDVQFRFSRLVTPDFRHPWYQASYAGTNNFTYIQQPFMLQMIRDLDPRANFYFRRQSSTVLNINNPTDRNTMPCSQTPGCSYGYFPLSDAVAQALYGKNASALTTTERRWLAGFFGRERADPAGVPLDGGFRTMPGVYPAGGFYDPGDKNNPSTVTFASNTGNANTAPGGGIFPILTYTDMLFLQIEGILSSLGMSGNARSLFETAMRTHIAKVVSFGTATDPSAVAPTSAAIDAYVNLWLAKYDAAVGNDAKLDIVMQQYWFAGYGQGYHIYNVFRRTGYPSNLQLGIAYTRNFAMRLPYPQQETTLNPNAKEYESVIFDVTPVWWHDKLAAFPKVN